MGGTVRLETDRLILRKYTMEDAEILHKRFGTDEAMYEFSGWNPYETEAKARETVEHFIASYEDEDFFGWAIEENGRFVGTVGAYDYDPEENSVEIGISIDRDLWGRGYASETVERVLRYLTEERNIAKVKAWCAGDNLGSKRAMEKCGMRQTCVEKDALEIGGRTYDRLNYAYE